MKKFHRLRLIIMDIFTSGMHDIAGSAVLYKLMMLNLVVIIGTPFVIGFGLYDIYRGLEPLGYLITAAGFSCAGCFYFLRKTKNYALAGNFLVFLLFWMFLYLLSTGGSGNSGVLWYYSFPPIVLFLFGFRKGSVVILASLLLSGLILFWPGTPFLSATYSADIKLRFIPTVFVLCAVTSLFEHIMTAALKIEIKNKELKETIEELNKAEDALLKSRDSFQAIIDNIDEVVYVADMQTHELLLVNRYVRDMFGDISGKICWQTIQKGQPGPCSFCSNNKLIGPDGELLDTYIWEFQNTNNHRWYECRDKAVRWIDGRIVRLEVAADITERKETEEKVKALEVTKLANKAKDAFLANMSHEMRTPLQSILSYLALLSHTQLSEEQNGYIKPANNSALLLKTLINDILDLTRIEQGNIHISCILFDIRELLTSTVDIHRPEAESRGLGLACLIGPDIPSRLKGDPDRLRQILHNLVGNAIKFTEKGGINIEVKHKSDFTVSEGVCNGVELLFSVQDSGIGIPNNEQEAIFERFKQVHEGYSRGYGGAGLGLSISRKLLGSMGGNIWVKSEPNKGSTFYFTAKFDVAGIDEIGGASPVKIQSAAAESGKRKRILIVDDEKQCSYSMEIIFKTKNYETATASSGKEALERLKKEAFDLIFMDVSMPRMDGLEATRLIREGERGTEQHTPIIALTGHGYDSDIAKFKQAGMDNWLIKPATYDDLILMLDNYSGDSP